MHIIPQEETTILQVCLACLPFFDTFSATEKQELLQAGADLIRYDTGEFLIAEGGGDQMIFFLLSGAASVVREGASIPIAELLPGDFFGEMAFLTAQKRTSNVIAHPPAPTQASVLPERICAQLSPDDPSATIVLRFNRGIFDCLQRQTRIQFKDQIIAVLVERMEQVSERVEEAMGEVPEFGIDPELERLLAERFSEEEEETKDQIIQHLVAFIIQLNKRLFGER
ncbi:MAG: cyclic nucleotide-binding domain-containing protein [Magnetococcales bacterium]|nr:cyclic nucleotide-binding domain-containing protein [Magnetococcales bacterium]